MQTVSVPGAKSGDVVVVRSGPYKGSIGRLEIKPGFETVGFRMGCIEVRMFPTDLRPLSTKDRVVNP